MGTKTCTVEDCDKAYYAKGFCRNHYNLNKRNGYPGNHIPRERDECSVEGCVRDEKSKGFCELHYNRQYTYGDVGPAEAQKYSKAGTETYGYFQAHKLIRKNKGPASIYTCVDCPNMAQHWTLMHEATDLRYEDVRGYSMAFSNNVNDYAPRCVECHSAYDKVEKDG